MAPLAMATTDPVPWLATALHWATMAPPWAAMAPPWVATTPVPMRSPTTMPAWAPPARATPTTTHVSEPGVTPPATTAATTATVWWGEAWARWAVCRHWAPAQLVTIMAAASRAQSTRGRRQAYNTHTHTHQSLVQLIFLYPPPLQSIPPLHPLNHLFFF